MNQLRSPFNSKQPKNQLQKSLIYELLQFDSKQSQVPSSFESSSLKIVSETIIFEKPLMKPDQLFCSERLIKKQQKGANLTERRNSQKMEDPQKRRMPLKNNSNVNVELKKGLQLKMQEAYQKLSEMKQHFNVRKYQKQIILASGKI